MKPISATSNEGRALQALRVPTGISVDEAWARWPASGTWPLQVLVRMGLAEKVDDTYRITEAGRAACPFRNPKAALPANAPEVFSMPRAPTAKDAVLAAIVAAGPAGITRAALAERLGATLNSASNHLDRLANVDGATVARLDRGLYVAQKFIGADGLPVKAVVKESMTTDADPAPTHDIDGISLDVDHHDAADLAPGDLIRQMAQIGSVRYAIAFPSEFHESPEAAIADAMENYETDSLKKAIVVACVTVGRVDLRPVFVKEAA